MAVILQFPAPAPAPAPEPTFAEKVLALRVRLSCANYGHRYGPNPNAARTNPTRACVDCGYSKR